MIPRRGRRWLAALSWLLLITGLPGCSLFVGPSPAGAPLRASLAAEALYGGPLKSQPKDLALLGTQCKPDATDAKTTCRFGDATAQRGANLGGITLLEPSETGASLRAPWIQWTQFYRFWDAAFSQREFRVADVFRQGEQNQLWEGEYTPLFDAFRNFEQVSRLETPVDQTRLRYELSRNGRAVLVGRIRRLLKKRDTAPQVERERLEQQVRGYLEILAAAEHRAEERVRKLEALAQEEAQLYAALADSTRTLAGLQRNITNHLMRLDLVLSAEEAKALAEATREKLNRLRGVIDTGRKAELEEQKRARPPEWVEMLREALDTVKSRGKE